MHVTRSNDVRLRSIETVCTLSLSQSFSLLLSLGQRSPNDLNRSLQERLILGARVQATRFRRGYLIVRRCSLRSATIASGIGHLSLNPSLSPSQSSFCIRERTILINDVTLSNDDAHPSEVKYKLGVPSYRACPCTARGFLVRSLVRRIYTSY